LIERQVSMDSEVTEIDSLVERLGRMPGGRVGRGPRHPRSPDPSVEPRVREFLQAYPPLGQDAGYVEFLEKYAGVIVQDPGETRILDILGFSGVSTDMIEMDGPVVDENGFLVFAQCLYYPDKGLHDMHEHDFAFSVAGERRPGVHRHQSTLDRTVPGFTWYVDDFTAWLRDLLAHDGWYERPWPA
jgi:hypothetical protein